MFVPLKSAALGIVLVNPAWCSLIKPHYQRNHLSGDIDERSLIIFAESDDHLLIEESFSAISTLFKEQVPTAFVQLITTDNCAVLVNFNQVSFGIEHYERDDLTNTLCEHTQLMMRCKNHNLIIKSDVNSLCLHLNKNNLGCLIALSPTQELCLLGLSLAVYLAMERDTQTLAPEDEPHHLLHFVDMAIKLPLVSLPDSLQEAKKEWIKLPFTPLFAQRSWHKPLTFLVNTQLISFIEQLDPLTGNPGCLLHFVAPRHTLSVAKELSYFAELPTIKSHFLKLSRVVPTDTLVNLNLVSIIQQGYNAYGQPNPYLSLFFVNGQNPISIKENWSQLKALLDQKQQNFVAFHACDGLEVLLNPAMVSRCLMTPHSKLETTNICFMQTHAHITVKEGIFKVIDALWSAQEK